MEKFQEIRGWGGLQDAGDSSSGGTAVAGLSLRQVPAEAAEEAPAGPWGGRFGAGGLVGWEIKNTKESEAGEGWGGKDDSGSRCVRTKLGRERNQACSPERSRREGTPKGPWPTVWRRVGEWSAVTRGRMRARQ